MQGKCAKMVPPRRKKGNLLVFCGKMRAESPNCGDALRIIHKYIPRSFYVLWIENRGRSHYTENKLDTT
jgi:hypothetical protein